MFGSPESALESPHTIAEVADVQVGIVIKPSRYYADGNNGVKAFRSLNIGPMFIKDDDWVFFTEDAMKETQRTVAHTGDVLVVRSGNPGTSCVVPPEYDGCNVIDLIIAHPNKNKVLPEYLSSYTNMPHGMNQINSQQRGVAQKHFNVGMYKDLKLILPSMDEQKCFVEFLQQSDKSKFSGFKSQFIEMFGDPEENPKGWRKTTFEEISEIITDGEHATPRRVDEGIYLLSARNVLNHELSFDQVDYIDQDEYDRIAKRIVPKAGDVLISCSGTVGRACVVPDNLVFQMVRSVALVRFKSDINPVFMEQQITMPFIQNQIDASKSQTSQANLFQGKIKKLEAMVPPVDLQKEFLEFVEQSDKSKLIAA